MKPDLLRPGGLGQVRAVGVPYTGKVTGSKINLPVIGEIDIGHQLTDRPVLLDKVGGIDFSRTKGKSITKIKQSASISSGGQTFKVPDGEDFNIEWPSRACVHLEANHVVYIDDHNEAWLIEVLMTASHAYDSPSGKTNPRIRIRLKLKHRYGRLNESDPEYTSNGHYNPPSNVIFHDETYYMRDHDGIGDGYDTVTPYNNWSSNDVSQHPNGKEFVVNVHGNVIPHPDNTTAYRAPSLRGDIYGLSNRRNNLIWLMKFNLSGSPNLTDGMGITANFSVEKNLYSCAGFGLNTVNDTHGPPTVSITHSNTAQVDYCYYNVETCVTCSNCHVAYYGWSENGSRTETYNGNGTRTESWSDSIIVQAWYTEAGDLEYLRGNFTANSSASDNVSLGTSTWGHTTTGKRYPYYAGAKECNKPHEVYGTSHSSRGAGSYNTSHSINSTTTFTCGGTIFSATTSYSRSISRTDPGYTFTGGGHGYPNNWNWLGCDYFATWVNRNNNSSSSEQEITHYGFYWLNFEVASENLSAVWTVDGKVLHNSSDWYYLTSIPIFWNFNIPSEASMKGDADRIININHGGVNSGWMTDTNRHKPTDQYRNDIGEVGYDTRNSYLEQDSENIDQEIKFL